MMFASDNWAGAAPEIMAAIAAANEGYAAGYGADELTQNVEAKFAEAFECELSVFFVATGGAANGLALSVMTPPYGMILCHEESHIQMDECAGPEFFTGGAKLLPLKGHGAKLTSKTVKTALAGFPVRPPHGAPASVLSITQATECGTLYSVEELASLCAVAHGNGLSVHMDGARFSNALAALKCSPAEMSWKAGVDVLCLGGTKNGCLAAEAVIFFDPAKAADFEFRRKRAGHLWSKHRFLAAQFGAWFEEDLWLRLAAHANSMAALLSEHLGDIPGVEISYPTQANEVFVAFPDGVAEKLRAQGAAFYPWVTPGDPAEKRMQRLIANYTTTVREIDELVDATKNAVQKG